MNCMNRRTLWTRVTLTAFYFTATFLLPVLSSADGEPPVKVSMVSPSRQYDLQSAAQLGACFASLCGAIALHKLKIPKSAAAFISFAVALLGFISIPYWIYMGYGHFRFENTVADVSCIFQDGFDIVFPIIIAPPLAALTSSANIWPTE